MLLHLALALAVLGAVPVRTASDCLSCFQGRLRSDAFVDVFGALSFLDLCQAYDAQCVESNCGQLPHLKAVTVLCSNRAGLDDLAHCFEPATVQMCVKGANFAPGSCQALASAADCVLGETYGCDGDALTTLRSAMVAFSSGMSCPVARAVRRSATMTEK